MGADRRVDSKANHEAAAGRSKGVVNLALGKGNVGGTVNAGIGSLKTNFEYFYCAL